MHGECVYCLRCIPHFSATRMSSEWLVERQRSAQDLNASKFLNFAADEVLIIYSMFLLNLYMHTVLQIEEAWHDHVMQLGRTISASTAVNTYFLFGRLFGVLRLQFSSLTHEACNYLGEDYKTIASHFLVTTEFLLSQFEIPKVYIDADIVSALCSLQYMAHNYYSHFFNT